MLVTNSRRWDTCTSSMGSGRWWSRFSALGSLGWRGAAAEEERDDRAPPARPRSRLLGQSRSRLRRDGGGGGAAPGAGGGGERRVLLRSGAPGGLDRARQPDRAGVR